MTFIISQFVDSQDKIGKKKVLNKKFGMQSQKVIIKNQLKQINLNDQKEVFFLTHQF